MDVTEFGQYIKNAFDQEFQEFQTVHNLETGFLEVVGRTSRDKKPSINVAEIYNMARDRVPWEEAVSNILKAYHMRMENDGEGHKEEGVLHPKNIIFIAVGKSMDVGRMERHVYLDKGDVILLFGSLDANGKFCPLANEDGINIDMIYGYAVKNLRRDFPCRCIPLCDFVNGNQEELQISFSSGKDIYVLSCENDAFAYSSTGLYYSSKEIKELSQQIGKELFIFRCTVGLTLMCPLEAFTMAEASEIMKGYSQKAPQWLSSEALVYAEGRLQLLSEYQP